jgi:hypothetical protein
MRKTRLFFVVAPLALAAACKPNLGNPPSLVEGPRMLAVRGVPAEAAEGDAVTYDVLAVDVTGRIANPAMTWAICHEPKPPAEANAVAAACLTIPDEAGPLPTFMAPMPPTACKQFGPQPPDVERGKPPLRPRDPDVTGGFYQPVRTTLTAGDVSAVAFALERIKCRLANAPADATGTFNMTYKANANPTVASVTLDPDGAPAILYGAGQAATAPSAPATWVSPGSRYVLEVAWPADTPESYPVWNLVTQTLDTHREAVSVSWFATDGSFEHDRTGRGEAETDLTTRNVWTAPDATGIVHLWVVLRDSRGGIDFAEAQLRVGAP